MDSYSEDPPLSWKFYSMSSLSSLNKINKILFRIYIFQYTSYLPWFLLSLVSVVFFVNDVRCFKNYLLLHIFNNTHSSGIFWVRCLLIFNWFIRFISLINTNFKISNLLIRYHLSPKFSFTLFFFHTSCDVRQLH